MFDLTFFALAALFFVMLVGAWMWVSASWDRLAMRGTERTRGRIELIGFRYRGQ